MGANAALLGRSRQRKSDQVIGGNEIGQSRKNVQKSAKMALFAAVAPGGKVQRAIRGARVGEHIRAGYHADAGAQEAARGRTRPADARSFWASFSPLVMIFWKMISK